MASLSSVSDGSLLRSLSELVVRDQQNEAELLRVLGEVNERRLYLEQGCSSMYAYCTEVLHMSEGVGYHRINVARKGRSIPELLERIRRGELHLSGAVLLAPRLTADNHIELLDLARYKSKRTIEELLADQARKPDAPALVRRIPAASPAQPVLNPEPSSPKATPPAPAEQVPPPPTPVRQQTRAPEPLGQQRYKVQFTASRGLYDKLRQAQALLRHQVPDGDLAEIFDRALTLLVKESRRRKFADVQTPREKRPTAGKRATRHIPAEVRRAVEARDRGQCAFVGANGRRCRSRDFLEFHHREPWSQSKRHAIGNIELRCRAHNQYAAAKDLGTDYMARFSRRIGSRLSPGTVESAVGDPEP
jgi:hypothetical protein